jgi:hypothetical protein
MKTLIGFILVFVSLTSEAEPSTEALRVSVEKRVEATVRDETRPYMHARRSPSENAEAARMKIGAWIRYNFENAFAYKSKGDIETALFHFFMARHALRDSALPAANDEQGNPAIADANHVIEHKESPSHSWRDKIDEDTQAMFDSNSVPAGDLLRMYGIDSEKGPVDRPNQVPRPDIRKK